MNSLASTASIRRVFLNALRPPPKLNIAQWTEANRVLATETSANAGQWRNSMTPWVVEIMECLSPGSPYKQVGWMKSARVAGTEVLNNTVGGYMTLGCPIMVAQPTESDAEEWSKDHLDPMIASTPCLAALVTADKDRRKGNTILHKKYRGGIVYIGGASSGKFFRRKTIRFAAGDEVDVWPLSLPDEGDPGALMVDRLQTYRDLGKAYWCSTPTVKGRSRIETLFTRGDQRHFHVPCPSCGMRSHLVWGRMRISSTERDDDGHPLAEYICEPDIGGCGTLISHADKSAMVAAGKWKADNPGAPIASFHINALYSPWVTWGELAAEYLAKKDDPVELQTFWNTKLGLPWDLANSEQWNPDALMNLRTPMAVVPARAVCLTIVADTARDRLSVQLDAWGAAEERWTLQRWDLLGDPSMDPADPESVWHELDALRRARYPVAGGGSMRVAASGVDTGGEVTEQAYKYCRSRRRERVWALKGAKDAESRPLWPKVPSRRNKGKVELYVLGVDSGKEACMSRLRRSALAVEEGERGGPGFWHFNATKTLEERHFEELTNETSVVVPGTSRKGVPGRPTRRWMKRHTHVRNEGLDLAVYGLAVLQGLIDLGAVRLESPPRKLAAEPTVGPFPIGDAAAEEAPVIFGALHKPPRCAENTISPPAPPRRPPAPPRKTGKIVDPFNTP
jgi:phage terminase large subunit GpA-like protein